MSRRKRPAIIRCVVFQEMCFSFFVSHVISITASTLRVPTTVVLGLPLALAVPYDDDDDNNNKPTRSLKGKAVNRTCINCLRGGGG